MSENFNKRGGAKYTGGGNFLKNLINLFKHKSHEDRFGLAYKRYLVLVFNKKIQRISNTLCLHLVYFTELQKTWKGNKAGITRYDRTRVLWSTIFGAKNARAQA